MAKQTKMSKKIMEEIEGSEVQMHSKVYFQMLHLALIGVVGVLIILTALMTIIIFRDIQYGERLGLRGYGGQGYAEYAQALPWFAIVFALLGFLITYVLVKRFNFTYKHRLYTVIGALVFAVAGLGIFFASTGADKPLVETGPFRGLHTISQEFADEKMVAGEVVYIEDGHITILSPEHRKIEVYINEDTRGRIDFIEVGDKVFCFGEHKENGFEAFGIREGDRPLPPHIKGAIRTILK
jgi:hypothetical protein